MSTNDKLLAADIAALSKAPDFYVHGIRDVNGDCERVEDSEAQFWGVYRRFADGTSMWLSDHATREQAEKKASELNAPKEKSQAEPTLSALLTQRVTQFANSATAVEIIDKGVEKLFQDLVNDAFRSYGDFGKQLTDAMKAALPSNISEVIELQKYNHMVSASLREAWAKSDIHVDMQQKVLALVEEFTSDEAVPKFIMASDLWKAFIEDNEERATEEQWGAPQVLVEESDFGFIYVGLHPEAAESGRYSSSKKSSAHSCDFMLAFNPQKTREGLTDTPVTHEGHQAYELFSGHMDNGVLGKKVIKAYSRFDKLVMALYYGGSFLVWDESPEDISYPGHDY